MSRRGKTYALFADLEESSNKANSVAARKVTSTTEIDTAETGTTTTSGKTISGTAINSTAVNSDSNNKVNDATVSSVASNRITDVAVQLVLPAEYDGGVSATPEAASTFCRDQLWLALRFYDFPLEVLCRGQSTGRAAGIKTADIQTNNAQATTSQTSNSQTPDSQTIVVVAEERGQQKVVACNQAANDRGVRSGMSLAAAYAMTDELQVLAQDEAQEQAVLMRLATWAKKYTPLVSLGFPDVLLLEVKGSLALFDGLEGLMSSTQYDLLALGFQHYAAVAPTPTAALWLSCYQYGHVAINDEGLNQLLGNLPIAATGWPQAIQTRLQGMGVRHLRDCMRLPRDGFARRIGKQHLLELDRALGKAPDPRENYYPPDKFVAKREFMFALENVERIFFGLEILLKELVAFLRGRQCGIQVLTIKLYHHDAPASCVELGMVNICRDQQRLASLLQQKLDQLTLPEAVLAVTMVSGPLYSLSGRDGELFDQGHYGEVHWPELVEKLRARLGVRAVTGLCLVPEHRPEHAWKYVEPGTEAGSQAPIRRPLWVLSDPCRMPLRQNQPHWHGVLTFVQGPERIESGWWDGQDAARDYYVVTNRRGLCLWIYQQRGRQSSKQTSKQVIQQAARWYLHGIFA